MDPDVIDQQAANLRANNDESNSEIEASADQLQQTAYLARKEQQQQQAEQAAKQRDEANAERYSPADDDKEEDGAAESA